MKVCISTKVKKDKFPELKLGNLYQNQENKYIYIYAYEKRLINLESGTGWAGDQGFGKTGDWIDVTDKYCVKEI